MSRKSKIVAMFEARCPQCRKGKMFMGGTYRFHNQRTNEICPYCGLQFEIEPGYFYAAMYVSYAMSVAEVILVGLLTYLISHSESPWLYAGILFLTILGLSPVNYRYSRLILLYYLTPKIKYDSRFEDV